MRVLDIFMVVLIAGTWSPAMTQDVSTIREKLLNEWREIFDNPDSVTARELRVAFAEIKRLVSEECRSNGGSTAFDGFVEGLQKLGSCLQPTLDVQNIDTEIERAVVDRNWKPVLNKYCQELSVLNECSRNFTDSFRPCLKPEERDVVNRLQNVENLILEFICHDGGDAIASFLSTDGPKCLDSKNKALRTCLPEYSKAPQPSTMTDDTSIFISSEAGHSTLNLGQEDCEFIVNSKTCVVGALRGCENPKSADAMNAMFTAFEKLTTCKNFAASSDGSANSAGVISPVSGLLITTAMTMYLRF